VTAPVRPGAKSGRARQPTATARFGSSRRESHDATGFYERFVAPELSDDSVVARPDAVDVIHCHDARDMAAVPSGSVALVATSPPYFAGKEYEVTLGEAGVPGTYFEYLALLRDVFAECKRVLEPGGRIAVNVANLGRRPYRSLAGDVTQILQDLGLLLRGEVIWWKGRAAGGSCAWGTFQKPRNPVLRDVTERIVIASKGRFDRALTPEERFERGLPSTATISRDEFLGATTDLWEIPPESATRVGHPAPFPIELPTRLIDLYTYEGDVVLDPFMGSGSTAVAAVRTGRRYVGFDTDQAYVDRALARVAGEVAQLRSVPAAGGSGIRVRLPAGATDADEASSPADGVADGASLVERAVRDGLQVKELAQVLLEACGFVDVQANVKVRRLGIALSFVAVDQAGASWAFDLSGALTTGRSGLRRTDTLWKALGRAAVVRQGGGVERLILLTTEAPIRNSAGHAALAAMMGPEGPITDVIELLEPAGHERLRAYARGEAHVG
jgi:DNA modification methylase